MADKIDYKAYLAQLGKVETNQVERIKKYLEEQIQQDEALKALYRPEKINDCYDFIMCSVEKMPRNGQCAFVDDAIVFKMARDYFLEVLPKVAENAPEVKTQPEEKAVSDQDSKGGEESVGNSEAETELSEAEAKEENTAQETENENEAEEVAQPDKSATMDNTEPKADDKGTVTDEYGFEVFGEEGAETAAEAETEAETEPETQEELPADNENSETSCGEAEPENEKPSEDSAEEEIKYDSDGQGLLFGF